jgi:hypothetical protein
MITLNNKYTITKIKKKTTAAGFNQLLVGDDILLSIDVKHMNYSSKGNIYVPKILIEIPIYTKRYIPLPLWYNTFNQFCNNIKNFELKKIGQVDNKIFKYELDELVFYMLDNKIHSAKILKRDYNEIYNSQKINYRTSHGEFRENELFATKEDLLKTL